MVFSMLFVSWFASPFPDPSVILNMLIKSAEMCNNTRGCGTQISAFNGGHANSDTNSIEITIKCLQAGYSKIRNKYLPSFLPLSSSM